MSERASSRTVSVTEMKALLQEQSRKLQALADKLSASSPLVGENEQKERETLAIMRKNSILDAMVNQNEKLALIADRILDQLDSVAFAGRKIQELFDTIDTDASYDLSRDEFENSLKNLGFHIEKRDTDLVFQLLDKDGNGKIDRNEFTQCLMQRRCRRQISNWVDSLGLNKLITLKLMQGIHEDETDPLQFLMYKPSAIQQSLNSLKEDIERVMKSSLDKMRKTMKATIVEDDKAKSKFVSGQQEAIFVDLPLFMEGLDNLIGLPHKNVREAMAREHESEEPFVAGYLEDTTTPKQEWEFVMNPRPDVRYPGETSHADVENYTKRMRKLVSDLKKEPMCQLAELSEEELIGLRLYTGPMYNLYNPTIREFLHQKMDERKQHMCAKRVGGMKYVTTIRMIASGIVKLSKFCKLPVERKVYRGLNAMTLPDFFFWADKNGFKGAVEPAFMSTSLEKRVALNYLNRGGNLPILLEIDVGQVDRGADVSWLSQYPSEHEMLFPPLSNLEVVGPASLELFGASEVVKLNVRVNINLKSLTREQIESRRKTLHLESLNFMIQEIDRDLHSYLNELLEKHRDPKLYKDEGNGLAVVEKILNECVELRNDHEARPDENYNENHLHRVQVKEISNIQEIARNKLNYWVMNAGVTKDNISSISMFQVWNLESGKLWVKYNESKRAARENKETEVRVRQCAVNLSKFLGYLGDDVVDQPLGHDKETSLMHASSQGDARLTELLLDAGCHVNFVNEHGDTALLLAARNGHTDCLSLLVERNGNPSHANHQEETALMHSSKYGQLECVQLLLGLSNGDELIRQKNKSGATSIHLAADNGQEHVVLFLCKRVPLDVFLMRANSGKSCLHYAAGRGHLRTVQLLAEKGGRDLCEIKDNQGRTAEEFATKSDFPDISDHLRKLHLLDYKLDRGGRGEESVAD